VHLQRADGLAARAEAPSAARFAGNYATCFGLLGRAEEARERFAEAQRVARERSDFDVLVRALNNHGNVELTYGPIAVARQLYDEGLSVARATKNLRFVAWLSQNAAMCALIAGDSEAAGRHQADVDAIRHDVGTVIQQALATNLRRYTLAGAHPENFLEHAWARVRAAIADKAPATDVLAGALAHELLRAGRDADAAALVAQALTVTPQASPPYWLHDTASRCAEPDVRAAARDALAVVAAHDGAFPARGFLALADAREALRRRRRDDAVALAEAAVDAFRTAGWRVEEAFALELAGRPADAVALLRSIGAVGEVRRLTETGVAAPRRRGESTLTAREREIATLVVAGHATRAVADTLVISERTVETHIAAIYRKLGVSNRTALARLLDETGVAAP
jgi:DNA-binding NarL/FixJ family response regulator